jgi:fibulin 1/2
MYESFCKGADCASEVELQTKITANNCSTDYRYNADLQVCEDIDECADQEAPNCAVGQICVNRIGSFECLDENVEFTCGAGLVKLDKKCVDVDECATASCPSNTTCINYLGGFVCKAAQSDLNNGSDQNSTLPSNEQEPKDKTKDTEEDDFLSLLNREDAWTQTSSETPLDSLCKSGESCGQGAHGPNCSSGQHWDLFKNACVTSLDCKRGVECDSGSECVQLADSSNVCLPKCKSGFERIDSETINKEAECQDVDECGKATLNKCNLFNSKCVNKVGSYECECKDGYRPVSNSSNQVCEDIDECAEGTHNCPANSTCFNKSPLFECRCNKGFEKKAGVCVDVDECADSSRHPCQGQCINQVGGHVCHVCPFGFENGRQDKSCVRINHCSRSDSCKDHQFCVSLTQQPRCVNVKCPSLYTADPIQNK